MVYFFLYISGNGWLGVGKMTKRKFTTTMDPELIKQLKLAAVEEDVSVANILDRLIKKFLDEHPNAE